MKIININIFISILFIISCNSPTEPPADNAPPGKRDYTWSIDSVDYGNRPSTIQLESIWGSSATDIWGAGYTSDVRDCLWHYNGFVWKRATDGTPIIVGGNGSRIVGRVWGTGANDVWAIGGTIFSSQGDEPFVIHFDGNSWSEVTGNIVNMPTGCTAIYGTVKNDFWVSELSYIVHYKDGNWIKYKVGDNLLVWGITGEQGIIFADAYDISGGNKVIIVRIKDGQQSVIDESIITNGSNYGKFEPSKLWLSNGNLYTAWHQISITSISNGNIDQSGWHSILTLPSGQFFVNSYYYNTKDYFAVGNPSLLYEYNGSDWQNLLITIKNNNITKGNFFGIWTDGNELFICDTDSGIIYHGR